MPTSVHGVQHRRESSRTEPSLHLGRRSPPPTPRGAREDCDVPMRGRASTKDSKPDPETGVAPGFTRCRNMRSRCRCSMCPAIHINSRSWLRSSSTHEPSDPPLRVVSHRQKQRRFRSRCREAQEAGERGRSPLTQQHHRNSKVKTKSHPGRPVLFKSGRDFPCSKGPAL